MSVVAEYLQYHMGIAAATYPIGLQSFPALLLLKPPIPRTSISCSWAGPKQTLFIGYFGESGFRVSETEVLKQSSSMGRLVVCVGDGAVQGSINLSCLRYGISVWLDVPLDIVADGVIKSRASESMVQKHLVEDDLMGRYKDLKDMLMQPCRISRLTWLW